MIAIHELDLFEVACRTYAFRFSNTGHSGYLPMRT